MIELSNLEEFLASIPDDLERGVLSPRVFNDPDLHELELDRIFTRSWVFVGHESEIPEPGDYVLRNVGRDEFILARAESGEINLLFNTCMHRGTAVCHAERGNTSHFRCPYHGWIYKNNGDWNGAPKRVRSYGNSLDPKEWGLRKAPHVDSCHGLIFACLDPEAVTLDEYLGDMKWYLDVTFGLSGMKVVGDPHRWEIHANWKSPAENFAGDIYHVSHLHRSVEEVGAAPNMDSAIDASFQTAMDSGHHIVMSRGFLPSPTWQFGVWPQEVADSFDLSRLTADQRAFLESGFGPTVFTVFPNFSFIRVPGVLDPTASTVTPVTYMALRLWQPTAANKTEIWNLPIVWTDAPEWFNKLAYDTSIAAFGPAGMIEQDDSVAWERVTETGASHFARRSGMKLNYQLGQGGKDGVSTNPDWPYPGIASTTAFDEHNQRAFFQRWHQEVTRA